MMKKISLLFLPLCMLLLSGCQTGTDKPQSSNDDSDSISLPDEDTEKKQTYKFFLDYSHSDEVFYTMKWWNGYPLVTCPEPCQLTSEDAPDEAFPIFLGWSKNSISVDGEGLWNFATDTSMNREVILYGIWASE